MTVGAYIKFNGNCRKALNYYANLFETEPNIMTFSEMPPNPEFPIPDDMKDLVMHGNFTVFGSLIMVSDAMPGQEHMIGDNLSLIITWDDPEEIKRVFEILSKDGSSTTIVNMRLRKVPGNIAGYLFLSDGQSNHHYLYSCYSLMYRMSGSSFRAMPILNLSS